MEDKQSKLINSLLIQPLIVVIRLDIDFFNTTYNRDNLLSKIKNLSGYGVRNIEIGWDSNPEWIPLISQIKNDFNCINLGAASVTSIQALDSILSLDLNYSMSPFFNREVHLKAIKHNQLLIPGVSSIGKFKEAINLGYKIIKIYPASNLGIEFLNKLKSFEKNDIFFIGAGGIKSSDLKDLLKNGYNALAIGKELNDQIAYDNLKIWLKTY